MVVIAGCFAVLCFCLVHLYAFWQVFVQLSIFKCDRLARTSKDLKSCPWALRQNLDKNPNLSLITYLHKSSQRISKEFPKNSQRIPKEFPKNSQKIPKKFPKNFQKIPKEFPKNSQKIPKEFPKNSQRIPKNSQKIIYKQCT